MLLMSDIEAEDFCCESSITSCLAALRIEEAKFEEVLRLCLETPSFKL